MEWDDKLYKAKNTICEEAWEEFLFHANILLCLDVRLLKESKINPKIRYREPDIYSVFDRMRQVYFSEGPYGESFVAHIDGVIDRGFKREERERQRDRPIGYVPSGN